MKRKHKEFWVDVDGKPVHMLADLNMTNEQMEALKQMIRHVQNMPLENEVLRTCIRCGQYETTAPHGVCWRCKQQEIIDDVG